MCGPAGPWTRMRFHRGALGLALLTLLSVGCATKSGTPMGGRAEFVAMRYRPATPLPAPDTGAARRKKAPPAHDARVGEGTRMGLVTRSVLGGLRALDPFEEVLLLAGLDMIEALPPSEAPFTPEDAAALQALLLAKPVSLANFGPRLVAVQLLREVLEGEEELTREVLFQRVRRFKRLAVLRPDGYLAWALSGKTQQRVAPVQWKDGAFRAHGFEVGRFYSGRNGMAFFPVDDQLQDIRRAGPLAEVYDDSDLSGRVFDGAEESLFELGQALAALIVHPLDSAAGLAQLPQEIAALIAHSPEYLERFRLMTRGEQIKALSKLTLTLLSTYRVAAGSTRTLMAAGKGMEAISVPALSVTAEGALVLERVAVPVGRTVMALSGGPGAAIILQRARTAARSGQPAQGPGQWGPAHESMSPRAARYQEQISGRPASEAYWVGGKDHKSGGVKFDGFEDGVLLEAKGRGYANKFNDDLTPKKWFAPSGAKEILEQARRQLQLAGSTRIRWHVAEEKAADAIQKLLQNGNISGIEVVFTPPLH